MLKTVAIYSVLITYLSGCVSDPMFSELEISEKKHNKLQQQKVLIFMGLDEIFPDPKVRALAKAAGDGNIGKIQELVASGVDVNTQGISKGTPLFWAIHKENLEGFEALLKLGASPNVRFDDSGTVMHWAARNKDSRFLQLALSYGGDPNVLGGMFEAPPIDDTIDADDEVIPANYFLLIDAGTDISIKGKFDSTLLSQAASRGRYDVVLDLLNRGAEYQTINKIGRNPLYYWIAKHEAVYKSDSRIYKNKKLVEQWFISRGINYKINNK